MNKLIVDYGTSSCRASIVNDRGMITASHRKETSVRTSGSSAEIDLDFAWKTVSSVINEVLIQNSNSNIQVVGVSSLLGWVFLDSNNIPIGNSIIWMDSRSDSEFEYNLKEQLPDFQEKTGRRYSADLLISKWGWLTKNNPELCRNTSKIISFKDELVRRLTGTVVTDYAHINYSMLWNIRGHKFDSEMLEFSKISTSLLPEAVYPYEKAGTISSAVSTQTGLVTGTPVIVGSIDGTTAMYGGGMAVHGTSALVSGTTDVLMYLIDSAGAEKIGNNSALTLNTGFIPGMFAAGGATGLSGGAVKKMVELFNVDYIELLKEAGEASPGAGGLIFIPGFSGERSPYWNSDISGSFIGLRLDHSRGQIIRSLMEGTAFRLKRLFDELRSGINTPLSVNIIGGNARIDQWNYIKADILEIDLQRPVELEATTMGTALFCDCFLSGGRELSELSSKLVKTDRVFKTRTLNNTIYRQLFELYENFLLNNIDNFSKLEEIGGILN